VTARTRSGFIEGTAADLRARDDQSERGVAAELERAPSRAATRGAEGAATELFAGACRLTPTDLLEERARRELGQATALRTLGDLEGRRALAELAAERLWTAACASAAPARRHNLGLPSTRGQEPERADQQGGRPGL